MNRVLLVGCGHMGSALLNEWINLKSHSFTVVDPLSFNPFAAGTDPLNALATEKISHQIMSVVNSFAAAAEGAGGRRMRLAVVNMSLLALESKRTHLFIDRDEQYLVRTGIARWF